MNSTTGLGRKHACLIVKFYIKSDRWKKVSAVTNHMSAPVISLTVRNTSKFLASSGGMFLKSSLWRKKTKNYYKHTKCMALYPEMHTDSYPIIPVTRKWRLPWILVQLMKLLMLLESTVCLSSAPVPSHTTGMTRNNHIWQLRSNLGGRSEKFVFISTFWAKSAAELTLPLAFFLYLHLVWRTGAHAGATIHHKMSCEEEEEKKNTGNMFIIHMQRSK